MYRFILSYVELVIAFHAIFWGAYLLLRVSDWGVGPIWSILRSLTPAPVFGAIVFSVGGALFLSIIFQNLKWRRRMLWVLAHIWALVGITAAIGSYGSLATVNYLTMFVLVLAQYLRIAAVTVDGDV